MRTVTLDGRAYRMRDVLQTYKEQRAQERKAKQLALFEFRDDSRPATQRTAQGRYEEPTLF